LSAGSEVSPSSSSQAFTKLVSNWLAHCTRHDHACARDNEPSSWVPTRLLDLGKLTGKCQPKLIDTTNAETFHGPEEFSKYASLSHCWGKYQPLRLVHANYAQLKEGVALEQLPKTFVDAIHITRSLGVRYLWIDSLCIIQDSEVDWLNESAKMRNVYSGAEFSIAATSAMDSSEGLFLDRNLGNVGRTDVTLRWEARPERAYTIVEDASLWRGKFELLPLNRRAWAVQERALARRVLHFTKEQIIWECRAFAASELFPEGLPSHLQDFHDERYFDPSLWLGNRFATGWAELLRRYTRGELSFSSDRLVAISGLVSLAQSTSSRLYLAGLWQDQLPMSLLWVRGDIDVRVYPDRRRLKNLAPSWSWASLYCPIHAQWTALSQDNIQKVLAKVLECRHVDILGLANLQVPQDLSLVISAPIGKITWERKSTWRERINDEQSFCVAHLNYLPIEGEEPFLVCPSKSPITVNHLEQQIEPNVWNDVIFDAMEEDQPPSTLWCLPISIGRRPEYGENCPEYSVFGLLLDEVEGSSYGKEVLRRVGVFTVGYPDGKFFENSPMRNITLV
jgi:hypothetical protein